MAELLNTKAALEMVGDERDLLKQLLEAYLQDKPFDQDTLNSYVEQDNKLEAAKYVHYYKGAGRQLGAEQLGDAGQKLENVLRGKETGDVPTLIREFSSIYHHTVIAIKAVLSDF